MLITLKTYSPKLISAGPGGRGFSGLKASNNNKSRFFGVKTSPALFKDAFYTSSNSQLFNIISLEIQG